jgi:hypothetical protein
MVEAGEIVLPFSSGHLVETGPLHGERRVAHACTVLEFCRGWQMRNPVAVRDQELSAALDNRDPRASEVFTLDADVLFTRPLITADAIATMGPFATLLSRLVAISSIYSAVVDPGPIPDEGGKAAALAWAKGYESFAIGVRGEPPERVRRMCLGLLLTDLVAELLELVDGDPAALVSWTARAQGDVEAMPYLGRLLAVVFARVRNATGPWRGSDLNDLHCLCSAAGYADIVCGEKRTIGDLKTARRVVSGAALATTLAETVDLVHARATLNV